VRDGAEDWKRLVAYSSVSHMGFVVLGLFALTPTGITGSLVQQINHGISTGALFLLVGVVYERRHTRQIDQYGGIAAVMPLCSHLPADDHVVDRIARVERVRRQSAHPAGHVRGQQGVGRRGGSRHHLGAAYMLWLYQRTMFGEITHGENRPQGSRPASVHVRAADPHGVLDRPVSKPFVDRLAPAVQHLVERVSPGLAAGAAAAVHPIPDAHTRPPSGRRTGPQVHPMQVVPYGRHGVARPRADAVGLLILLIGGLFVPRDRQSAIVWPASSCSARRWRQLPQPGAT
jgi:hypothetical protein